MSITLKSPRRRDNPNRGQNTGQIPTRSNIQRQNVATDPGGRGGPSTIPTGAFTGASEGMTALGAGMQQYAAAESQQLQQELNRSDYINTELEKGNLSNDLERAANNFDPVSGSYTNTDGTVDNNGMVRLNQVVDDLTQKRVDIMQKNMSVSQRASDEFPMQAELVKQNVFAKLRNRTAEARTEQYKLSLQAQLVQVAADKATASDVVELIRTNKKVADGFISSLDTKARNEALATANAGLLKHAVRKFVLGGQFLEAKTRIRQIIGWLGEYNISTTGWTAKSIREANLYIDEEQTKYNNTQQAAQTTDKIKNVQAIDRIFRHLPVKKRNEMKLREFNAGLSDNKTDKIKEVEAVATLFAHLPQNQQNALKLRIYEGSTDTPDWLQKAKYIESQYKTLAASQNGKLTPDQEIQKSEELTKVVSGLTPKTPTGYEQDQKRKKDVEDYYQDLKDKQGGALTVDQQEAYSSELQNLRSKTQPIKLDTTTKQQNIAIDYLTSQFKKKKISQAQFDRLMMKVKTGEDLPVEDLKVDNSLHRLVSDLVDSHFGADVKGPNARKPQSGYEEFSTEFKSAVMQAYITGEYSNGLSVGKDRDLFDIINYLGKSDAFAGKGPKRLKPETLFDNRVGIELKGAGNDLRMEILDQPFLGDVKDATYREQSIKNALDETNEIVKSSSFRERLITAGLKSGITYKRATGLWSSLKDTVASFSQFLGGGLEDPRFTQSRLLYSLIARDFIRFVSLSPRFAVKEQELLRDLFPSSSILNSPRQTRSRLTLFRNLLKKKIGDLRSTAINTPDQQEEAIEGAKVWANTIRNINTLMPEVPRLETIADFKKLSPKDAFDYLHTEILGDSNRKLSRSDLNDYKERLIQELGEKAGKARFKILNQKLTDLQTEIRQRKTP